MAVSIDQQFIEYIVKSLVGHPDEVKVERRVDEKGVLLELLVNPEDLGRVIGKRGATAQSLRTLLRALGTKNDARYNLKIVDTDYPEGKGPKTDDSSTSSGQADDGQPQADEEAAASKPAPADDSASTDAPVATSDADELDITDDELPKTATEDHSDIVSRTRKELADLDDLDV